jgi:L-ascorbate metabolism protein UlaG (beta-lactamase superfamily)
VVPPFLDRIYYRGPVSDHFDGSRFFNPHDAETRLHGNTATRMLRGEGRARWPDHVPVERYRSPVPFCREPVGGRLTQDMFRNYVRCRLFAASGDMFVTWMGHSSVLIQAFGLNILTDPVWSERASPFSFAGPRRVREPPASLSDLPRIDLIVVSHNHYDHMDLQTLKTLWDRDHPLIVTSLGNDSILAGAGIQARAGDWGETISEERSCALDAQPCLPRQISVTIERVHHWSSRWLSDRNRALWSGFTIRLPGGNVFFAGDTGLGDGSWVHEAARHGPFRLAIIPIGAYAPREVMKGNHLDPQEALQVFQMLGAQRALGVHWGTFQLTFEPIDAPRRTLEENARQQGVADRFIATEVGHTFSVPLAGLPGAAR